MTRQGDSSSSVQKQTAVSLAYQTDLGAMYLGDAKNWLESGIADEYRGKVQLIFTSPPFPLNHKKKYGNLNGEDYIDWLSSFASIFSELVSDDGSIVIELGNSWVPGRPVMSSLTLRSLLALLDKGKLHLCQQFVCYNPARLPSPAQWVNVERIRVKDAFTHIWWMSPNERPKADNRQVTKKYSKSMKQLLSSQKYNAGKRPSGHRIGETSFLQDNKGAIPPNVLVFPNTRSSDPYRQYCTKHELPMHPARMPFGLPEFFIKFLTDKGDIVLDPFAGSNTTGAASERLGRRWISTETNQDYIEGSRAWFPSVQLPAYGSTGE